MKVRSRVVSEDIRDPRAEPGLPSLRSDSKSDSIKTNAADKAIVCHVLALVIVFQASSATADNPGFTEQELTCLARNVYFEARNQPIEGQRAVAYVTLNRLDESTRLNTICEVVYRPGWFSWTRQQRHLDDRITDQAAWDTAWRVAKAALSDREADPVHGSTFFHSVTVAPNWAAMLVKVDQIGDHIFYARPKNRPQPSPTGALDRGATLDWSDDVATKLALQPELTESNPGRNASVNQDRGHDLNASHSATEPAHMRAHEASPQTSSLSSLVSFSRSSFRGSRTAVYDPAF